ncbi:MAG: exodeoxyribonuclease III [Spirochaetaceae bacterium]|jgi:exodeoxyribonuclease-3|nr:exodeoxyribonuclease III [Spirochaetaceae bacterium]
MNIVSWNVNGVRAAEKKGFAEWLAEEEPDILCVQETKAEPGQLSGGLINPAGKSGAVYKSFWASAKKKGYSGTAIYTKTEPLDVRPLGVKEFDDEGRVLQADYGDFALIWAYFPNSRDGGSRLSYQLDLCAAILERCAALGAEGRDFILCGDYNIAHRPVDLARPADNEKNAGFLPEERAWMEVFAGSGAAHVDTFRHFYPDEPGKYTWWSYRFKAREKNIGWRIDYFCVNLRLMPNVKSSVIMAEVKGSDHCPVKLAVDCAR